ncbi:MAG: hypothetical protein JWP89_3685 [Schlesneria sp.]|nr:hypothetical protein [Schlesneria sp.]
MAIIYECRTSLEEDRPEIDFRDPINRRNDWLLIGDVIDGSRPLSDFPVNVKVRVAYPDATHWDFYQDGGMRGLISQRFVNSVGVDSFLGLCLVPTSLNGAQYYLLRLDYSIDCFDRAASRFKTFRSDPTAIQSVSHYSFREERLPTDGCSLYT